MCACTHGVCEAGAALQVGCDPCVTQLCGIYSTCCSQSWSSACVAAVPATCGQSCTMCGNGTCEPGETCSNCPNDCGVCPPVCGNGTCQAGETCSNCPNDCGACPAMCGNGACEAGESCSNCPNDCGVCPAVCGNGVCDGTETCSTCSSDCGACSTCHDVCSTGPALSPSCDFCAAFICLYFDPYCCVTAWDATCVIEANDYCAFCF